MQATAERIQGELLAFGRRAVDYVESRDGYENQTQLESEVYKFQVWRSLHIDGVVGPQTKQALGIQDDDTGVWSPQRILYAYAGEDEEISIPEIKGEIRLTTAHFRRAAADHNIAFADLRSFIEVEAAGSGFWERGVNQGKLKILLEAQWAWARLRARGINPHDYLPKFASVIKPRWDRSQYTTNEYNRLALLLEVNKEVAYESVSMGLGQIMGFHYAKLGYPSASEMFEDFSEGEDRQLTGMIKFMESSGVAAAIRRKDYRGAVRLYNGSGQVDYYLGKWMRARQKYV